MKLANSLSKSPHHFEDVRSLTFPVVSFSDQPQSSDKPESGAGTNNTRPVVGSPRFLADKLRMEVFCFTVCALAGGIYRGIFNPSPELPILILFDSPDTGSTLCLEPKDFSVPAVRHEIVKSNHEFGL